MLLITFLLKIKVEFVMDHYHLAKEWIWFLPFTQMYKIWLAKFFVRVKLLKIIYSSLIH